MVQWERKEIKKISSHEQQLEREQRPSLHRSFPLLRLMSIEREREREREREQRESERDLEFLAKSVALDRLAGEFGLEPQHLLLRRDNLLRLYLLAFVFFNSVFP